MNKRDLNDRQAKRRVFNRNEGKEAYEGECLGHNTGNEPLILRRCHRCGLSQLYKALGGGGLSVTRPAT